MSQDLVGFATCNEVDDIVLTEILLDGEDGGKGHDELFLRPYLLLGMEAVVAIAAVFLIVCLTEIMEQHLSTTYRRLCVSGSLLEQLATNVLFSHWFALHKLVELFEVLVTIESKAHAFATIASGTSCLLIIAFKTLGDVVMNNETHIGFVDTHTKGYCRHDNIYLLHQEIILSLGTRCSVKTGMIGSRLDIVGTEDIGKILHFLARETIYDSALSLMLADEADNVLIDVFCLRSHLIVEVGTVE